MAFASLLVWFNVLTVLSLIVFMFGVRVIGGGGGGGINIGGGGGGGTTQRGTIACLDWSSSTEN